MNKPKSIEVQENHEMALIRRLQIYREKWGGGWMILKDMKDHIQNQDVSIFLLLKSWIRYILQGIGDV